jgi:Uma2 family endonuclease
MELLISATSSIEQNTYEQTNTIVEIDVEQQYQKERNKPMPSKNHSRIQGRLAYLLLKNYGEKFDIFPEFELELLGKKTVPDVTIFPISPSDWENDELRSKDAPILAIEILSPKQASGVLTKKIRTNYFKAGVKSAWIVFPDLKNIVVLHPNGNIQTYYHGILHDTASGFDVDLNEVFK